MAGAPISAGAAGGGPTGPVFAVTLVRPSPAQQSSSRATASLFAKLRTIDSDNALYVSEVTEHEGFRSLAERLTTPEQPQDNRPPQPAAVSRESGALDPRDAAARPRSRGDDERSDDARGQSGASASTGALWGKIAPCWRNLGASRVPVTLEIELDSRGQLRRPPGILRSEAARLDDPRLQAEERAIAALAACLPRNDVRFGGKTYRLDFPAKP